MAQRLSVLAFLPDGPDSILTPTWHLKARCNSTSRESHALFSISMPHSLFLRHCAEGA